MLGHQGGWDELLLPALVVALVLLVPAWRRRRRAGTTNGEDHPQIGTAPGTCGYCGASVEDADERCPACGFRITR